jgi:hypothetical protein
MTLAVNCPEMEVGTSLPSPPPSPHSAQNSLPLLPFLIYYDLRVRKAHAGFCWDYKNDGDDTESAV